MGTSSPLSVKKNDYRTNPKRSDIETPLTVCKILADIILEKYGDEITVILDPSAGNGNLTKYFTGKEVIEYELKRGSDFLKATELPKKPDLVLCNPPFNLGVGKPLGPEIFLDKIIKLCGKDVPIVLVVPMGFRLNQKKNSKRRKKIKYEYPPITSFIDLCIDSFENVLFHSEILLFNMPLLKPHYVLDEH